MNETEIRERLRDAVGEAHYPSALKSKVESRLRDPASPGHPRLVGLIAAALAVIIVGSLVFIRLQSSTGFLPAAHPQTRPSSAPTVPPSGTLQSIGRLPVEDLAVANLSQAADAVSTPDLLQTSSGRAVRLVGAYADTAGIVLILRSLPAGQPMVQISDDSGPINSGYGEANGAIGDLVVSYMQPPRAGADGVAHLGVTVSNFVQGPPAVGSANSGVWSFSVSLKIQPATPLTLSPTLTSVGSWKVTVEKFELTPSVVHLRAVVDGPSSIDVNQNAFALLDDAGNPINVAGASFVPKGGQKSTQVDMSWGRVLRATTYRLQVKGGGSTYTSGPASFAAPPAPASSPSAKGGKGQALTPLDFPAAAESLNFGDAMSGHISTGRPQSCGAGSGGSGQLFSFATYFQINQVWYWLSFSTDPTIQQYHGPGTYSVKASLAPVSPLGPTEPTFVGSALLVITSDSGLHEGNVNGTLHWTDDQKQTVTVSGKWTCMPGRELGPA